MTVQRWCIPDTGAEQTVLPYNVVKEAGFQIVADNSNKMEAANGSEINILGTCTFQATYQTTGKTTEIVALVAKDTLDSLISWHDLIELGWELNHQLRTMTNPSESAVRSMTKIVKKFNTVFSDELSETPMKAPPMKIHLKDNAKPFRISTARQVPLRFKEESDKEVQSYIEKGVIVKVTEPTNWCAPGFFVPKPDGVRVRMVTDFTALNEFVDRPVHPFPSVGEVVQSVPSSAKSFAKLDAVHGYFQLALDEESFKLTTFLLPSGRYQYLRAPMGLSASSDEWCRMSDWIVEGLPWAMKIVDDKLVWASDLSTLEQRVEEVLEHCKQINITISMKKFQIAEEFIFAHFQQIH